MRYLSLILFGTFSLSGIWAQEFHTPADLVRIMDKSRMRYVVEVTDEALVPVREPRLNDVMIRSEVRDGERGIGRYAFAQGADTLFDAGERAFLEDDLYNARAYYLLALERMPDFAPAETFIGQTFMLQDLYKEAESWLEKAIDHNPSGYLARWFLADIHSKHGRHEEAVEQISTAYVLNRNNPRILEAMKRIYKAAGLKYQDFEFDPNYVVEKEGKEVRIRFSEDWMMYAFCKALWQHEPGYQMEMGGGRGEFNMLEEKECILNLAMGHEATIGRKKSKNPAINALLRAMDHAMINEFIFLEVWLRKEPLIIYTQPPEAIASLVQYVKEIRGKKR